MVRKFNKHLIGYYRIFVCISGVQYKAAGELTAYRDDEAESETQTTYKTSRTFTYKLYDIYSDVSCI